MDSKDEINLIEDEINQRANTLRADDSTLTLDQARKRVWKSDRELRRRYRVAVRAREDLRRRAEADEPRAIPWLAEEDARQKTIPRGPGPRAGTKQAYQIWVDAQILFLQRTFALVPEVETQLRAICELPDVARNEELEAWAKQWNLTAPWCRQKAYLLIVDELQLWPRPPDFTFRCKGWNPTGPESEKQSEKRIRKAFNEALKRHRREIQDYVEKQEGWVAPGELPHLEHFDWAVYYQVKGMSAKDVKEAARPVREILAEGTPPQVVAVEPLAEPLAWQSIQRAVNDLLEEINLPPRPGPKLGRRPTKKNTHNSS